MCSYQYLEFNHDFLAVQGATQYWSQLWEYCEKSSVQSICKAYHFVASLCRWIISKTIYFRTLKWRGNQRCLPLTGFQVPS